jgi:hypothetical protein
MRRLRFAMQQKFILSTLALSLAFLAVGTAQAQSTPAKKAYVARVLKVQQPVIEGTATALAERPAIDMVDRANAAIGARIAPEKRDALAKDIQGDVKKYLDETVPFVRDRAIKLAPQTIGAVLEAKLSEEELKQLATFLESSAYNKFQLAGGDMQKSLLEKLLADTRATVEPKVNALDQAIAKRLNAAAPSSAPTAPAK